MPINRIVYRDTTVILNQEITGGNVSKGLDKMLMEHMKGDNQWITPLE
jgi:hypothetical protein